MLLLLVSSTVALVLSQMSHLSVTHA